MGNQGSSSVHPDGVGKLSQREEDNIAHAIDQLCALFDGDLPKPEVEVRGMILTIASGLRGARERQPEFEESKKVVKATIAALRRAVSSGQKAQADCRAAAQAVKSLPVHIMTFPSGDRPNPTIRDDREATDQGPLSAYSVADGDYDRAVKMIDEALNIVEWAYTLNQPILEHLKRKRGRRWEKPEIHFVYACANFVSECGGVPTSTTDGAFHGFVNAVALVSGIGEKGISYNHLSAGLLRSQENRKIGKSPHETRSSKRRRT